MKDFDEREKEIEEGPLKFIKEAMPLLNQIMNRPKPIEVKLELQPYQLLDLAVLAKKWENDSLKCD